MPRNPAPIQNPVINSNGMATQPWVSWFAFLSRYINKPVLESYTVSTLPAVEEAGAIIFVTDESGGAVPAFSDGTNWRRVTDRAVVS